MYQNKPKIIESNLEWIRLLEANGYTVTALPITDTGVTNALEDFGKIIIRKYHIYLNKTTFGYVFYFDDGELDFILTRNQVNGREALLSYNHKKLFDRTMAERAIWGFYLEERFSRIVIKT